MSKIFIEFLNLNFAASVVAVAGIIIRLLIKKSPKKLSYFLMIVVMLRFALPFTVSLPAALNPTNTQIIPKNIVFANTPTTESGRSLVNQAVNGEINSAMTPENSVNLIGIILEVGAFVWLFGITALLLYAVVSILLLKRRLSTAIKVHSNIYETDRILSPFVLGFARPKIFIPMGICGAELDFVLAHERAHIKRLDHIFKPLTFFIAVAHWFNPLVWISYSLLAKDIEHSTDEFVLNGSTDEIRKGYGNTLFSLSAKNSGLFSPIAFGETGVKLRIKNILNYKKPVFWVSLIAVVAITVFTVGFAFVNRQALPEAPAPVEDSNNQLSENYSELEESNSVTNQDLDTAYILPVSDARITRGYTSEGDGHWGYDFAAPLGTEIVATQGGTVILAKESNSNVDFGNFLLIEQNDGLTALYAQCSKLIVKVGDTVNKGQKIAEVGSSGNSTGNHLHFALTDSSINDDNVEYESFNIDPTGYFADLNHTS